MISLIAVPKKVNPRISDTIQIIGGITQYRALDIAPDSKAKWSIIPHVIVVGSPKPRKLKTDSAYTAQVTIRTVWARIRGITFGSISLKIRYELLAPIHLEASTNALFFKRKNL